MADGGLPAGSNATCSHGSLTQPVVSPAQRGACLRQVPQLAHQPPILGQRAQTNWCDAGPGRALHRAARAGLLAKCIVAELRLIPATPLYGHQHTVTGDVDCACPRIHACVHMLLLTMHPWMHVLIASQRPCEAKQVDVDVHHIHERLL
jgi:hypothetical protein